ncbi:MAG: carbohydrate ABC transporter permease [Armatimonadetes bacterium]|nr:carbohydrate ABC transporter permease [Armatimonadota bacterium]
MNADLLYALNVTSFWIGVVFYVRFWLLPIVRSRSLVRQRLWGGLAGAILLIISSTLPRPTGVAPAPKAWVPLALPVMPFPAWFLVATAFAIVLLCSRLSAALNSEERARHLRALVGWAGFGVANVAWLIAMHEPVTLVRGALPVTPALGIGVITLLAMVTPVMRELSRAAENRGLVDGARFVLPTLASAIFCLPLVWMLLTSFKEQQDNTSTTGLVWVPMVTETHRFTDPERPLVQASYNGQHVLASVVGKKPNGNFDLEVERPFPLRGNAFEADPDSTKPTEREGIVVTATLGRTPVRAVVTREIVGGARELQVLEPASLRDRKFQAGPGESEPVRRPGLHWQNYSEALEWLPPESHGGLVYLQNTLWIVVLSVLGTLLSCSLVAYGFSRVRFPGRRALFGLMVATMMLPTAVTMLPRFLIWKGLGAVDTLVPVWLPTFTASAFYVFLLRQFFKTVPKELEDAAKIDGCSPLRTYWQVMLPQVRPALAVIGIWTFMGAWNDFMTPLIYVSSVDKLPVSYAVQLFHTDKGGEFGLVMAFSALATLPVVVVFLLGQRYFTEGIQLSGLGGK